MAETFKTGDILVAHTDLKDPEFAGSVILILAKGASTVGVNIATGQLTGNLFKGGPIPVPEVVMVHPAEFSVKSSVPLGETGFVMTPLTDPESTAELVLKKPHPTVILAGYAGWGPGQIEAEAEAGIWRKANVPLDELLKTYPADRWKRANASLAPAAPPQNPAKPKGFGAPGA